MGHENGGWMNDDQKSAMKDEAIHKMIVKTYNFMGNKERYRLDPEYKALVDSMYIYMEKSGYTPQELRDAACTASLLWAQEHVEPIFLKGLISEEIKAAFRKS